MENRKLIAAAILLVFGVGLVAGATVEWTATSDVTLDATDGPAITLEQNSTLTSQDPFPDSNTVDFGIMTVTSDGETSARVTDLPGSETTLNAIETNGRTLWADHKDSQRIGVENVDSVTWDEINLDESVTEISVTGSGTLYVDGFEPDQYVRVDQSGEIKIKQADADGIITLTVSDDNLVFEETNEPVLTDPYPTDEEPIGETNVTLQTDVDHEDFPAESVDIVWSLNGEEIKTTTSTEPGTVSVETNNYTQGLNEWSAEATDSTGETTTVTGSFRTPDSLEIRKELKPNQLLDDTTSDVEVTFFGEDGETVVTRTTSDGIIDMDGLPVDQPYTIQIEADGYLTRQSFARSVVEQQKVFVLNDSAETVETEFTVSDPTGQFSPDSTRIFVKKPMEIDGETTYQTVVADRAGVGGFATALHKDQRYLIEVENTETEATRQLGPYAARTSRLVELNIDAIDFDFASAGGEDTNFDWDASFVNETGPAIEFEFGAEETIDKLDIKVTQQNDDSVVIIDETFRNHDGPIDLTGVIPDDVENPEVKNWKVEWTAEIDGDETSSSTLIGSQGDISVPGIGDDILGLVGIIVILIVGGFFSAANITVGAIVVSLISGALWTVGVVPGAVSGIFITIALLISVLYHLRRGPQPR